MSPAVIPQHSKLAIFTIKADGATDTLREWPFRVRGNPEPDAFDNPEISEHTDAKKWVWRKHPEL